MQHRFHASRIRALNHLLGLALLGVFALCKLAVSEELTTKSDAKDKAVQLGIGKIGSVVLDRNRWIVIGRRKNVYVELKLDAVDGQVIAENRLSETPEYDIDEIDLAPKCNPNIGILCTKRPNGR
jgi:hypothetical protein